MKLDMTKQNLQISLHELCDALSEEDREVLMQYAVYDECLLTATVETLVSGWAFGDRFSIGGLRERLLVKLLPVMPEAFRDMCRLLLEERDWQKNRASELQSMLWCLVDRWPREVKRPEGYERRVDGHYAPWSVEEVERHIAGSIGAGEWAAIKAQYASPEIAKEST